MTTTDKMTDEQSAIRRELGAFRVNGMAWVSKDDLAYAVHLRKEISFHSALLNLLHTGQITVHELDENDLSLTTLALKKKEEL